MPPFNSESSKLKDYKRWGMTIAYVLLFVFIIVMLYCLFPLHVFVAQKHIRTGRAVPMAIIERNSGLVTIQVTRNVTVAARIDLCDVVPCEGRDSWFQNADVYICVLAFGKWGLNPCLGWTYVYWNSNPKGYVNPNSNYVPQGLRQRISFIRDKSTQRADNTRYNPLVITVRGIWKNQHLNELVLILGADVSGRDPQGLLRIQFVDIPPDESLDISGVSTSPSPTTPPQALVTYLNVLSPEVIL
ncbi:hypothetical protein XENORESO_020092 [Xenotaenia resolanae]|uniref:Uncharacterized protein n=1 Tax=Xenotaenia resolanae TaxID=208358 RepID=A0ABV0X7B1_9TELE